MNPITKDWYADPESRYYEGKYWVYVTQSFTAYQDQLNIDVLSSEDGLTWQTHKNIIDMDDFPWVTQAVWAPTIIKRKSVYYLIFASNDIQSNDDIGGLEIAYSNTPQGPFKALLKQPLLNTFINEAQPIDAHLFEENDEVYLYYGGWGHCNLCLLSDDMKTFKPFPSGQLFKEITPPHYVEAPCMLKKDGAYHFMWSSGNWMDGSYKVLYSKSQNLDGPFDTYKTILESNDLANGPGHHTYCPSHKGDGYHIFYHRRIIGDDEPGHRLLCRDTLNFDQNNFILPIKMT